jgi:hypothetical protein
MVIECERKSNLEVRLSARAIHAPLSTKAGSPWRITLHRNASIIPSSLFR